MEARINTVDDWFTMVRQGLLTLPRFQRFEVWRPDQIKAVLENMLRVPSLPIGALLTLEVGDRELFHSRPIKGAPVPQGKAHMNLLDGQQRMTAIWRSFTDDYEDFTVLVSLDDPDLPAIEIVKRHLDKDHNRMPAWADSPSACLERNLVSAKTLAPGSDGEQEKEKWVRDACPEQDREASLDLSNRIARLRERVGRYPIPFLSLPVSTDQDTAIDIFIKMNISASPLKDFDIVVAQIESSAGESLHDMISDLKKQVPAAEEYGRVEDAVLAVGALLDGRMPQKRTYLSKEFGERLPEIWERVVLGIERATAFLGKEMIFNAKLLPSEAIFYLAAALWADVPDNLPEQNERARTLIRKAIWRGGFTDRYLKTSTGILADHSAIKGLISDPQGPEPALFDKELHRLPTVDELIRGGWPARKDRLGRAIMAASLFGGGRDLASGESVDAESARSREYRQVLPSEAIPEEIPGQWADSALNCWFVSGKPKRKSAETCRQHLETLTGEADIAQEELRDRLESHMIPYDELSGGDFKAFLDERAKRIHAAMIKLASGERP